MRSRSVGAGFRRRSQLWRPSRRYEHPIGLQRWAIGHAVNGIVAEGRDITTVVAPDADARILLTASEEVRARRGLENTGEVGFCG